MVDIVFIFMVKYNILVTGSEGQLGKSIKEVAADSVLKSSSFTYCDLQELDLTDWSSVENFFSQQSFDIIINCAAYTAVDKAEMEKGKAFLINEAVVAHLANIVKKMNSFLIHISTDYVFDGESRVPYKTEDPVNPLSVYGMSKAAGEQQIIDSGCNAAIIRTSWLYSVHGHNFVKSILKNGIERGILKVVNDQWGAPTYAPDIAEVILKLCEKRELPSEVNLYHYANEGTITWFDFAKEIIQFSEIDCLITPVSTKEYPTVAQRPVYSTFDLSKIKNKLDLSIPHWEESLHKMLIRLKKMNDIA